MRATETSDRRKRISFRLILHSLILALCITLLLSTAQVFHALNMHKETIDLSIERLLITSEVSTRHAILRQENDFVDEQVSNLIALPYVAQATLTNTQGEVIAMRANQASEPSFIGFLTSLITNEYRDYNWTIAANPNQAGQSLGQLQIRISMAEALTPFYQQALYTYATDLLRYLCLSLIIIGVIANSLSQPLKRLSLQLNRIDPRAPNSQRLRVRNRDSSNELGQLAQSCNAFISSTEEYLEELSKAKLELEKKEELLRQTNKMAKIGGWEYIPAKDSLIWSDELFSVLGLPGDKPIEMRAIMGFIHPHDRERIATEIKTSVAEGSPLDIELRLDRPHDETVWVRVMGKTSLYKGAPIIEAGTVQDITEWKMAQKTLLLKNTAIEHSPIGLATLNRDGQILFINRIAASFLNIDMAQVHTGNYQNHFPNISRLEWDQWWDQLCRQGERIDETKLIGKNGEKFVAEIAAKLFTYEQESFAVVSIKDITHKQRQEKLINHLAYHDALTGLPNRSLMKDRLDQAIASAERHDHLGAVLFIDLDNFKKINDSLGHPVGDAVLKELAQRLSSHLRKEDTIARLGGDEFVVILPSLSENIETATQQSRDLAEKILMLIGRPIFYEEHEFKVTASIGIVVFPNGFESADKVIQYADTAMYEAKGQGRATISVFTSAMVKTASRTINLENAIQNSLSNQDFRLFLQPQFQSNAKQLCGAEVLLRWQHPKFGIISPAEFIPILESSGGIVEVGLWIIDQAFKQLAEWQACGLWQPDWDLSINVSILQLEEAQFVSEVAAALERYKINPASICLEVTETLLIENIEAITETLNGLKALGVKIAIDDFGTGYSSLSYLKRLPFDTLKIDRAFINDIPGQGNSVALVDAIITMAKQLNVDLIAEGVENYEQVTYLKEKGCEKFQGFLFGRPLPINTFEDMLAKVKEVKSDIESLDIEPAVEPLPKIG